MLYILEGNECCFKTTIADKLSKLTGFEIIKGSSFELSQKPNEDLYYYFNAILSLDDVIIDRFIYSNLVYADLYKNYAILNKEQVATLEKLMTKKRVKSIFLTASSETIKQRLSVRGDDYVKEDMVDAINQKYLEVMRNAKASVTWYDTQIFNSDEIANELAKYIGG